MKKNITAGCCRPSIHTDTADNLKEQMPGPLILAESCRILREKTGRESIEMEEIVCPLDVQFADEISALLKPPPAPQVQGYFDDLLKTRGCPGVKVKYNNGDYGKGIFADINFKEEELILKDQMLVGVQHTSNKIDCLVCSCCFCFIGSIELQIGRKLHLQNVGDSTNGECHSGSSDGDDGCYAGNHCNPGQCSTSDLKDKIPLPDEVVESLKNGELLLPHSEKFSLPPVTSCPGGCEEAFYCSKLCADSDWEACHSLLCTGENSMVSGKEALSKFIDHANDTNDIFLLAAKAISSTILRYKKLKASHSSTVLRDKRLKTSHHNVENAEANGLAVDLSLLLEAWKPISMGYKNRWWDCVALPTDVDPHDEGAFRMQIKEVAFTSAKLLKEAIFDEECAPLFSLEIYGNIIGMFELNNLDMVVASPVEDYFLFIDDLPSAEKKEAEAITRPVLDALGDDYSICCQGTAFFPLQSCMNHSCCPNAKAFKREEDRDGQATIIAQLPIKIGEEITISYINEDLPYEERQMSLADYGFRCKCMRCLDEQRQQL